MKAFVHNEVAFELVPATWLKAGDYVLTYSESRICLVLEVRLPKQRASGFIRWFDLEKGVLTKERMEESEDRVRRMLL